MEIIDSGGSRISQTGVVFATIYSFHQFLRKLPEIEKKNWTEGTGADVLSAPLDRPMI